jgi:hypothetical protein
MREALIAAVFLIVAAIVGSFNKPNEEQTLPIMPQPSSTPTPDHHHH